MSVYIQEVLGLLKRNKKKKKLDKIRDHFEFGKLYHNSTLNTGAVYNPKMEPFVIKFGDLVCEVTEDLTRTQPGSGNEGFIPVYTTPEGSCAWDTLKDSIITQNAVGDTITVNNGNLIVDLQLTAGSANILDLTNDRVVIVGVDGELEDDANFTMDGTTFTANVNVVHGTDVPGVPAETTTINSSVILNGPVYDSQGNLGQVSQVLVGLADGRVVWHDDDVVEYLTYGALWQGDPNNLKVELPIGTADQILISDGTTFSWQDNPAAIVGEVCDVYRIPLWTPDSQTLGCSLLIQDGNSASPATKVTNDGKLQQTKELFLDTVAQDDTLTEVLVRDTGAANEVKFRDVATIVPPVGFDTLTMSTTDDWNQTFLNAYVPLDDSTVAFKPIKGMINLTDGQEGYVIAENVKTGTTLAQNVIQFPDGWGVIGESWSNRVSWATGANNGYLNTDTLLFGESLKMHYINYQAPGQPNNVLFWDSCCKLFSANQCPTGVNGVHTIDEDTVLTTSVNVTDDGFGGYGLTYTLIDASGLTPNGNLQFNTLTGAYTFTPNANFFGTVSFTYSASDGYCSTDVITETINVIAVAEPPVFTSSCPDTSSLVGGNTYTYNYTVTDPDHPLSSLTVTFVLQDSAGNNLTGASNWLTNTYNGNGTGTITGTYPVTGGTFTLIITVTDPDTPPNSSQQSCNIAGLVPDKDTYFNFWMDSSGSMMDTIRETAAMSSQALVIAQTNNANTGGSTTNLQMNFSGGGVRRVDVAPDTGFNAGGGGSGSQAHLAWKVGMELSGPGITAGTTITAVNVGGGNNSPHNFTLSQPHNCPTNVLITGEMTDAMKSADYNDTSNLRNLLQDFYATGGTEQSGNTDRATNGSDRYDSHVVWCHGGVERFLDCIRNRSLNSSLNAGGWFDGATTIVQMIMYDESSGQTGSGYDMNLTTGTGWGNRDNATNTNVVTDVQNAKTYLTGLPSGVTFRATFFPVQPGNNPPVAEITSMVGFDGVFAVGTAANVSSVVPNQNIPATAYNQTTETFFPEYNSVPPIMRPFPTTAVGFTNGGYPGTIADGAQASDYYNAVRQSLLNHNFIL